MHNNGLFILETCNFFVQISCCKSSIDINLFASFYIALYVFHFLHFAAITSRYVQGNILVRCVFLFCLNSTNNFQKNARFTIVSDLIIYIDILSFFQVSMRKQEEKRAKWIEIRHKLVKSLKTSFEFIFLKLLITLKVLQSFANASKKSIDWFI